MDRYLFWLSPPSIDMIGMDSRAKLNTSDSSRSLLLASKRRSKCLPKSSILSSPSCASCSSSGAFGTTLAGIVTGARSQLGLAKWVWANFSSTVLNRGGWMVATTKVARQTKGPHDGRKDGEGAVPEYSNMIEAVEKKALFQHCRGASQMLASCSAWTQHRGGAIHMLGSCTARTKCRI